MRAGCGTEIAAEYQTLQKNPAKVGPCAGVYSPESDIKEERKIDQVIQLSNSRPSPCQFPDADFWELKYIWKVHESGFGSLTINCEFKSFIFFN